MDKNFVELVLDNAVEEGSNLAKSAKVLTFLRIIKYKMKVAT